MAKVFIYFSLFVFIAGGVIAAVAVKSNFSIAIIQNVPQEEKNNYHQNKASQEGIKNNPGEINQPQSPINQNVPQEEIKKESVNQEKKEVKNNQEEVKKEINKAVPGVIPPVIPVVSQEEAKANNSKEIKNQNINLEKKEEIKNNPGEINQPQSPVNQNVPQEEAKIKNPGEIKNQNINQEKKEIINQSQNPINQKPEIKKEPINQEKKIEVQPEKKEIKNNPGEINKPQAPVNQNLQKEIKKEPINQEKKIEVQPEKKEMKKEFHKPKNVNQNTSQKEIKIDKKPEIKNKNLEQRKKIEKKPEIKKENFPPKKKIEVQPEKKEIKKEFHKPKKKIEIKPEKKEIKNNREESKKKDDNLPFPFSSLNLYSQQKIEKDPGIFYHIMFGIIILNSIRIVVYSLANIEKILAYSRFDIIKKIFFLLILILLSPLASYQSKSGFFSISIFVFQTGGSIVFFKGLDEIQVIPQQQANNQQVFDVHQQLFNYMSQMFKNNSANNPQNQPVGGGNNIQVPPARFNRFDINNYQYQGKELLDINKINNVPVNNIPVPNSQNAGNKNGGFNNFFSNAKKNVGNFFKNFRKNDAPQGVNVNPDPLRDENKGFFNNIKEGAKGLFNRLGFGNKEEHDNDSNSSLSS